MPRKGELTKSKIDRDWPFQVTMPAADLTRRHQEIKEFCKSLSLCPRGHTYVADDGYHSVLCFAEREHANRVIQKFGGSMLDPKDRPKWPGRR